MARRKASSQKAAMREMNDMPMRQLGYSAPAELFDEFLEQVYSVIKVHVA